MLLFIHLRFIFLHKERCIWFILRCRFLQLTANMFQKREQQMYLPNILITATSFNGRLIKISERQLHCWRLCETLDYWAVLWFPGNNSMDFAQFCTLNWVHLVFVRPWGSAAKFTNCSLDAHALSRRSELRYTKLISENKLYLQRTN